MKIKSHQVKEADEEVLHSRPALVRKSSLGPNYIRKNLNLVNTPIKLEIEKDVMDMTENWAQEEIESARRLVKFNFIRTMPTVYYISFEPIRKKDFANDVPIISCIYWKEIGLHVVTSVDIIVILEYLIQESFTIEEKNRIRRNLQSLKPFTVSRLNRESQRFFNLLMSMEDPRPRNIEKNLKVFKWSDLFNAISKVISKYATNSAASISINAGDNLRPTISLATPYGTIAVGANDVTANYNVDFDTTNNPIGISFVTSSKFNNANESLFLPYERLKVMRRKMIQSHNTSQSTTNNNSELYSHALKPTDPVPLPKSSSKPFKMTELTTNQDGMEIDESNLISQNSNSSDGYSRPNSKVGSSESLAESNDTSISVSGSGSDSIISGSGLNLNSGTRSNSHGSSSRLSSNIFSNDSSSIQDSSNTSGDTSAGTLKHNKLKDSNASNNSNYQGFRIVGLTDLDARDGLSNSPQPQDYQYPEKSQLYHTQPRSVCQTTEEYEHLSTSNIQLHNRNQEESHNFINIQKNIKLPSLVDSMNNQPYPGDDKIQLPPILPNRQQNLPLPEPSQLSCWKQLPVPLTNPNYSYPTQGLPVFMPFNHNLKDPSNQR